MGFMAQFGESHPLPENLRKRLLDDLEFARDWAGMMNMMTPAALMDNLRFHAESPRRLTVGETYYILRTIGNALTVEINDRWLLYVPNDVAGLHVSPLTDWGNVPAKFPSTVPEITSGSECIAVAQPTAAVFHFMRVLERGLRVLAADRGISTVKQDVSTWGDLLAEIKKASDAKTGAMTRGSARKAEEEYYAGLMAEFRHFKDAWRDRVSHSNRVYDSNEAKSVLTHVRSFIVGLAMRLRE